MKRVAPHDEAAERSLLGAMLLAPVQVLPLVRGLVEPDDFYVPAHNRVASVIYDLAAAGADIDATTVGARLMVLDPSEPLKMADLMAWVSDTPTTANADAYAEIVAERAAARRLEAVGQELVEAARNGNDPDRVAALLASASVSAGRARSGLLTSVRDGTWLDGQNFPPLAYTVPQVIPEGLTFLVGAPKIGKSWLVLHLALGVAAGGFVLGRIPVEQRPVLYLALEDGDRRLQDRCRVLLGEAHIPEPFQYVTWVQPGQVVATVEQWLDSRPDQERAPLVILDTLGKVMPPALMGESSYQRDYRIGSMLKRAIDRRPGGALVINHHDRKATSDDFVDAVSGTHGLAGAADTVILLTRPRLESEGMLSVTGRDVVEGEYALELEHGGTWGLDGESLEDSADRAAERRMHNKLGKRMNAVLAFVDAHPEGVSVADVEAECGPDARQYLRRHVTAGRLRRLARGIYAPGLRDSGDSGSTPPQDAS